MEKAMANKHYMMVYNALREGIIEGEYDDNFVFVETEIAEKLGVSRTPVREAIKMLMSEKLLTSVPRKGIVCRPFKAEDIAPVYELAGAIEGMVAATVAAQSQTLDISGLRQCVAQMERALKDGGKEAWALADAGFHREMLALCGNTFASESLNGLQTYIQIIRKRYTQSREDSMQLSTRHHRQMLEMIEQGEAELARALVLYHWKTIQRDAIQALLSGA